MLAGVRTGLWWKSDYPLTLTAEEPNCSVRLTAVGSAPAVTLLTSVDDGSTWTPYTIGKTIRLPSVGDTVMFKAGESGNEKLATSASVYHKFVLVGKIAASGNANSLLNEDFESVIDLTGASYCFAGIFSSCSTLTATPKFPATATGPNCYYGAFRACSQITKADFPLMPIVGRYAFYSCRSLTTASFPACTSIGSSAFYGCSSLMTASFPACTSIGESAFYYCRSLTTASFPACTSIGSNAFYGCSSLMTASFPACTSIGGSAFCYCRSLTTASFPACTSIGGYAFGWCRSLTRLYVNNDTLHSIENGYG